jgi:hypothetical protein
MEQKKQGMTREELAGFTARANRYFKGETDRELWSLALPRIAEESAEVAMAALENYSIQWGGPRARFLPAKYFEFLADVKVRRLELTQREAREREARMRSIASSRDAVVCEADWLSRRREIETANPLEVGEAVDYPVPSVGGIRRSRSAHGADLGSWPSRISSAGGWSPDTIAIGRDSRIRAAIRSGQSQRRRSTVRPERPQDGSPSRLARLEAFRALPRGEARTGRFPRFGYTASR